MGACPPAVPAASCCCCCCCCWSRSRRSSSRAWPSCEAGGPQVQGAVTRWGGGGAGAAPRARDTAALRSRQQRPSAPAAPAGQRPASGPRLQLRHEPPLRLCARLQQLGVQRLGHHADLAAGLGRSDGGVGDGRGGGALSVSSKACRLIRGMPLGHAPLSRAVLLLAAVPKERSVFAPFLPPPSQPPAHTINAHIIPHTPAAGAAAGARRQRPPGRATARRPPGRTAPAPSQSQTASRPPRSARPAASGGAKRVGGRGGQKSGSAPVGVDARGEAPALGGGWRGARGEPVAAA
jgi:hypothetical protein